MNITDFTTQRRNSRKETCTIQSTEFKNFCYLEEKTILDTRIVSRLTNDNGNILCNQERDIEACVYNIDSYLEQMEQSETNKEPASHETPPLPALLLVRPDTVLVPLTETDKNNETPHPASHSVAYRSVAKPSAVGVPQLELKIKPQRETVQKVIQPELPESSQHQFARSESTPNVLQAPPASFKKKHQRAMKSVDYPLREVYAAGASRSGYIVNAKFQATSPMGSKHELTDILPNLPPPDVEKPMEEKHVETIKEEQDLTAESVAAAMDHSQAKETLMEMVDSKYSLDRGIQIDEKHANFVLMYDMLTGIRIAVSGYFRPNNSTGIKTNFTAATRD